MKWNKLRDEVHKNAVDHGWWEKPITFSEVIVLCHSELSEAMEEYRAGRPMVYCGDGVRQGPACEEEMCNGVNCLRYFPDRKPEGIAVELADCILRILDYMGRVRADVDGIIRDVRALAPAPEAQSKKPLPDLVAGCHYLLSGAYSSQRQAEILGRKRDGRKIKPARPHFPLRPRDFERSARQRMVGCILDIMRWAKANGVDMEAVILAKNEYNKGRPYRHGGKRL